MKKLIFLWNLMILLAFGVNSVEIKIAPEMKQGEPSYIYCDVGSITAGVTFFKDNQIQGNCPLPGLDCSSPRYTLTQNATGVLLKIDSVNASREEGEWYCQHDAEKSTKVSLHHYTIQGVLLSQDWRKPSGPVDTYSAVMTLSCTNQVPEFNFSYEDSESNTGIVPTEAVSTTTKSSYNGTTCENGNKFYEIILTARNSLDIFNNKKGVKFSFTSNVVNITAPFSVNFTAFSESTTESPNTTEPTTTTTTSTVTATAIATENNTAKTTATTTEIIQIPSPVPPYAIVIIVVACLAIVIVIVIVIICVRKFKGKKENKEGMNRTQPQGALYYQEEGSYTSSKVNTNRMTVAVDPVEDNPHPGQRSEVGMQRL